MTYASSRFQTQDSVCVCVLQDKIIFHKLTLFFVYYLADLKFSVCQVEVKEKKNNALWSKVKQAFSLVPAFSNSFWLVFPA